MGTLAGRYAVIGLGVTEQGELPEARSIDVRAMALEAAVSDAGLRLSDVGGYVFQVGMTEFGDYGQVGALPRELGWAPQFLLQVESGGGSASFALLNACMAVEAGLADYVAVGYGDTARSSRVTVGQAGHYNRLGPTTPGAYGFFSPGAEAALLAMRHMHEYGTTREQLGAVALAARHYASLREDAMLHNRPLDLDDYLAAAPVASPLSRYDYCLIADGGCAFIVTTAERAADMTDNPVIIDAMASATSFESVPSRAQFTDLNLRAPAAKALAVSGMSIDDIDVAQIYDCFTVNVILSVEALGLCEKGEGGAYVANGNLLPSGKLPVNTGGGELAWSYMQGFTPLCEGIRQIRGESGATQVDGARHCLVTGHGGIGKEGYMEYTDSCLILRAG